MSEKQNNTWDNEVDPAKIKELIATEISKRDEIESCLLALYQCALQSYANHAFVSMMVSRCTRAEVKFTHRPTHSEINILINALRVQMELLKEGNES